MFGLTFVGLLMCASPAAATTVEMSKLDLPIIDQGFLVYFAQQRPIRVDVSVCDVSGAGERALDFFILEAADREIPVTLRGILQKSPFIAQMIETFFAKGDRTLMVTETLSTPAGKGKINNFIGVNQSDFRQAK